MDLLERAAYLQTLDAALSDALSGQGRVALVSGEAGIGKTSLVDRFVAAHVRSRRVLRGACDAQFTPRPLGPLVEMASEITGAVPRLLNAGAERAMVFSAVLAELQARPTIAVFEDVHWADEATLDLLRFLGRRIACTSALLVLTYRDDELGPRHPLRMLLGDLAASSTTRRVPLSPLSPDAVRTLVGDRDIDALTLHHATAGNPFFVTEVLASCGVALPPTIRDAVLARAARLSPTGHDVLQAAAVIGPRLEPWLLEAVGAANPSDVDESLALGLLIAQGEILSFRHDLARQAILETISPPRRKVLHAGALAALRTSPQTRSDPARLAHHAEGAGDRAAVLAFAPAAARQAVAAAAHREAAALYALALRCADDLTPSDHAGLLEAYAWESNVVDQRSVAIAARRQAIGLWESVGNRVKQAENLARLVPMLIGVGQNAEAQRCSDAAIGLLDGLADGPEVALACRTQALVHLANRDAVAAIRWGQRAIDLAERCGDDDVAAMTHHAVGSAWLLLDYARGCAYLERHLASALASGNQTHVSNAFAHLARRSVELHRFHEAERYLSDGIAYADVHGLDMWSLLMSAWQTQTRMHLGRWTEAAANGQRVLLRTGMSAANRIPALVAMGRLQARQCPSNASTFLDEALDLAQTIGTAETLGMVRAARAERAWLAGDRERTLEEACAAYDVAVRQHHAWVAGELAFWRWRAGDAVPVLDWLAEPFVNQMTGDWQSAAEVWRRLGCPYEEARALADGDDAARRAALAILQRLGARQVAQRLGRELQTLVTGPVPRGPHAGTRANPFGLTARQLGILGLLMDDLTNDEIAARLSIAPKTVDHHVSAVLAKLDVRSRKAAARLAREYARSPKNREFARLIWGARPVAATDGWPHA